MPGPQIPPVGSTLGQQFSNGDAAQRRDAEHWRAFMETADDGILVVDSATAILAANPPAARLFGHPPGTSVSATRHTLLAYTLSSELDTLFRNCLKSNSGAEAEILVKQAGSRQVSVRVVASGAAEYIIYLQDRTELRRLERVRQDFVANVSHELRTPLTSVRAMAETLLDGALDDAEVAPRFLETIIRESDRLVRLSSDLLSLSRAEAFDVSSAPIDIGAIVQEICLRLSAQAKQHTISIVNHVPLSVVVMADYDDMSQVLTNLMDNAIAYTPRGGTVTVTCIDIGSSVTLSITDTGIGIARHDIPRIFERFYRADKARSRASGGTGLGLSIVKHLVESHGGSVDVKSEYNKGSTFLFTLPKPAHLDSSLR